jgi:hypothetical protein
VPSRTVLDPRPPGAKTAATRQGRVEDFWCRSCVRCGDRQALPACRTAKWSLLDSNNLEKGVKLKYTGGARCDGQTERSVAYHFECNAMAGVGEPVAVYGDCEFIVRWPSALACPIQPSIFLPILFWVAFSIGVSASGCIVRISVVQVEGD